MKISNLSYFFLSSIPVAISMATDNINNNNNFNINRGMAYVNPYEGEVQVPSDVPYDCVNLLKLYDYFNLGRPGFIVGEVMFNCCYYENRRLHSMDVYATTEWECENDTQVKDNHITSIILSGKNLSGDIPWDILKEFKNLQILSLNNNKLTGNISDMAGLSGSLQRINLSNNQITGTLPSNIPSNIQYVNINQNDISGPLPQSWTSKQGFQCFVPNNVCKPKSLTNTSSLCNSSPNSTPLKECTEEVINNNEKNNTPNNNASANIQEKQKVEEKADTKSNDNKVKIIASDEKSDLKKSKSKKSHAVLVMFFSVLGILTVVVIVVACVAKYKNVKHSREMKESLYNNRKMLQSLQSEEDTFFKDTAIKSTDENGFTLSKYSESVHSGSRHIASDAGSGRGIDTTSNNNKNTNINNANNEHAILMDNIDGGEEDQENYEFDNDEKLNPNQSKTFDVNQIDRSCSYISNKYNTTSSDLYDSSYCSTCETCDCSSVSSSSSSSSFTEENSSNSLSYISSCSGVIKNNNNTEDASTNLTLDSTVNGFDSKYYLTKRSVVSNTSSGTLINNNNNCYTTSNLLSNSVISSPATVATAASATTKFIEDDNLKVVLEDIEEEDSINPSLEISGDIGKGLRISSIFKESPLFTEKFDNGLTLNW
ncbi:hypothetical protein BCR32DRAFT_268790 [Anaeromyces robustus]|uniref:L domain-like protein n=1 Tax=Anaeromyces robustus TaxID=1754192 RepID=A0A1Y1X5E3_9FUNG|nr:hypothetical protein BCR32DRAFT_268790 [Anaeromyces robustus]|eukprot:ORX80576.1 hypothetical protein BCR32DRAFT_268790 [Anaeromyces robustus]